MGCGPDEPDWPSNNGRNPPMIAIDYKSSYWLLVETGYQGNDILPRDVFKYQPPFVYGVILFETEKLALEVSSEIDREESRVAQGKRLEANIFGASTLADWLRRLEERNFQKVAFRIAGQSDVVVPIGVAIGEFDAVT
jgi:hypothetical protein